MWRIKNEIVMAIRKPQNMSEIERLLVDEMTVGGEALDRALFFALTKEMSARDLASVRASVKERVLRFYEGVQKEHVSLGGEFKPADWRKTARFVERELHYWFSPWNRLAGKIEYDIQAHMTRLGGELLDERSLSSILLGYSRLEEYKPYLDREFKGFVSNRCLDYSLDYSKMAPELRTGDLLKKWESDYPYLLESKEWDVLSMAYKAGTRRTVLLQEKPELSNGFIGGETLFNRYLPVVLGPTLPQGKVTAVGQIDYKDCTNAFVVLDDNAKVLPFDSLSRQQKHAVLERVYDTVKYALKKPLERRTGTGVKM